MDERRRFWARWLAQKESFSSLCEEFGISRKTGYKWKKRFEQYGSRGAKEGSRRPHRSPFRTSQKMVDEIHTLRDRHRHWGPKKIRTTLLKRGRKSVPATSTIGAILVRIGARPRPRPRRPVVGARRWPGPVTQAQRPNHVWTMDFKGWFRTANGRRCHALTIQDAYSRFLLAVRALPNQESAPVRAILHKLFRKWGQPQIIRTDNGSPFAAAGVAGLSSLSVWFIQLGIRPEFISPGKPQQNGAHERTHRTLGEETLHPRAQDLRAQQRRFDRSVSDFNQLRPHEGIGMRQPAQLYRRSRKAYHPNPKAFCYPPDYEVRKVFSAGDVKLHQSACFIGRAFAGQKVGLYAMGPDHYEVYFQDLLLGQIRYRGQKRIRLEPIPSPAPSRKPTKTKMA